MLAEPEFWLLVLLTVILVTVLNRVLEPRTRSR